MLLYFYRTCLPSGKIIIAYIVSPQIILETLCNQKQKILDLNPLQGYNIDAMQLDSRISMFRLFSKACMVIFISQPDFL